MACGFASVQGWLLNTGKIIRKDEHTCRTATGWPWALKRCGQLLQVKITAITYK